MAQGVRSRIAVAAIAGTLAGCGGEQGPAPSPRTVDTKALADAEVVAAVLDECQRPLRGHMDRVAAVVTLPGGAEYQLFAQLPDKLRVQTSTERLLLVGDRLARIEGDAEVPPATAARVRALRTLLDAAAFGPLQRATGCKRLGPSTFALAQPAGDPVTLELRAMTLLPDAFTLPGGRVRIVDYVPQPATWIPRTLELDGLGTCRVRFGNAAVDWADDFFVLPAAKTGTNDRPRMVAPGTGVERRSPTPILVDGQALRWAVVPDPGDWPARVQAYRPLHEELTRQRQQIAGFPVLWQDGEQRWLAAPFRKRADGSELEAPAGWQLRDVEGGRWLVVYPPDGEFAAKVAAGERLLRDALRDLGLTTRGPITAQPFFHLHEGEPEPKKLAAPTVRVAVAVQ